MWRVNGDADAKLWMDGMDAWMDGMEALMHGMEAWMDGMETLMCLDGAIYINIKHIHVNKATVLTLWMLQLNRHVRIRTA